MFNTPPRLWTNEQLSSWLRLEKKKGEWADEIARDGRVSGEDLADPLDDNAGSFENAALSISGEFMISTATALSVVRRFQREISDGDTRRSTDVRRSTAARHTSMRRSKGSMRSNATEGSQISRLTVSSNPWSRLSSNATLEFGSMRSSWFRDDPEDPDLDLEGSIPDTGDLPRGSTATFEEEMLYRE